MAVAWVWNPINPAGVGTVEFRGKCKLVMHNA